jgi:hypothetical protein
MPGIVEFPRIVQDALAQYGDLFVHEYQRRHFAECLTASWSPSVRPCSASASSSPKSQTNPVSTGSRRCRMGCSGPQPAPPRRAPERPVDSLQRPGGNRHRQYTDRLRGPLDPRRRLVLGPRRGAEQNCSGRSVRQLLLHQRQALAAGVSFVPQAGAPRGGARTVPAVPGHLEDLLGRVTDAFSRRDRLN